MQKIAILSDVHANLHALRAVLAEIDELGIDKIVFGGDIVGYGARPAECVALVRERASACVLGNHDYYVNLLAERGTRILSGNWQENSVWAGVVHALEQLDEGALAWLADLPLITRLEESALVHASLQNPGEWHYLTDMKSALPTIEILREKSTRLGFFGHTHKLAVFADPESPRRMTELGKDRFVVPRDLACAITCGSVGQPRGEVDRRATWVLWDSSERVVEFRRTEYPALETAREILAAGLPAISATRLISEDAAARLAAERD